jgi:hypothetical protein
MRDGKSATKTVEAMKYPPVGYSNAGIEDRIEPFSERRRRRYP